MDHSKETLDDKIVQEGVESFPENKRRLRAFAKGLHLKQQFSADDLLNEQLMDPHYHGEEKPGCLFVKKRREKTMDGHYLEVFTCLAHGPQLELCKCGWEVGWHFGSKSKELQDGSSKKGIKPRLTGDVAQYLFPE